jgi:hypothetical protein
VLTAISPAAPTFVISEIAPRRSQPAYDSSIDTINGQAQFGPSVGRLFCLSHSFCSGHSKSGILTPGWAGVVVGYLCTVSVADWWHSTRKPRAGSGFLRSRTAIFPWSVWMGDFWSILGSSCCN